MQKTGGIRFLALFVAASAVASVASASRLGHAGISTTGATASQNQWNLICDPTYATGGSTSETYSAPGIASIDYVQSIGPYLVTKLVVQFDTPQQTTIYQTFDAATPGGSTEIDAMNLSSYGTETGHLQVFWTLPNGATPPADAADDNTFLLHFNNVSGNPNEFATFHNYEDAGFLNGGHSQTPDSYSGVVNGVSFTYSADPNSPFYVKKGQVFPDGTVAPYNGYFDTNSVSLPAGLPEPSSLALVGVGAVGLLRRRRRVA